MPTTITRKTHKKKIYANDGNGNQDVDNWIEVERTDELTVEKGKGVQYQKTKFKFVWPKGDDGEDNEDAPDSEDGRKTTTITIENPDGPGQVDLKVLDQVVVEFSKGKTYLKTKYKFDNTAGNDKRQVHKKTVKGSDGVSKVDIEIIEKWWHEFAKGKTYQQTKFIPNWPLEDDEG